MGEDTPGLLCKGKYLLCKGKYLLCKGKSDLQRGLSAQRKGNLLCKGKCLLCKGENLFWRRNKFLVVLGLFNPEERDMPLVVLVGGLAIIRST